MRITEKVIRPLIIGIPASVALALLSPVHAVSQSYFLNATLESSSSNAGCPNNEILGDITASFTVDPISSFVTNPYSGPISFVKTSTDPDCPNSFSYTADIYIDTSQTFVLFVNPSNISQNLQLQVQNPININDPSDSPGVDATSNLSQINSPEVTSQLLAANVPTPTTNGSFLENQGSLKIVWIDATFEVTSPLSVLGLAPLAGIAALRKRYNFSIKKTSLT